MENDYNYEYNEITYPYYDTTYLDDNNVTHIIKVKEERDVNFLKERFNVVSSNIVYN